MTMEKYGVEDVQEGQRGALELAKAKLLRLQGVLEKTASQEQEDAQLRTQIAELEAALKAQ
jgi:hypothetical protein